jgi:hypothetical protein
MNTSDQDPDTREEQDLLMSGLEQLARRLDAKHYPGHAWPGPAIRRRSRSSWRLLLSLAATAAVAALGAALIFSCRAPQSSFPPEPEREIAGKASNAPEIQAAGEPRVPQVLVVEDLESYSFIDLTAGLPVVSFAPKDSCSPTCVVPVLPEPASESIGPEKGF